jgi:hypothetical protein
LPFKVIPSLPLDYPMQDLRITEKRDDELSVITTFHTARHHLMHNVINSAVQKVVPRKQEEQLLLFFRKKSQGQLYVGSRKKMQRTIIVPRTFSSNSFRFNCSPTGNSVAAGVSSVVLLLDLELLLELCLDREPGRLEEIPDGSESGIEFKWLLVVVVGFEGDVDNLDAPALRLGFEGPSTLSTDAVDVDSVSTLSGDEAKPAVSTLNCGNG